MAGVTGVGLGCPALISSLAESIKTAASKGEKNKSAKLNLDLPDPAVNATHPAVRFSQPDGSTPEGFKPVGQNLAKNIGKFKLKTGSKPEVLVSIKVPHNLF